MQKFFHEVTIHTDEQNVTIRPTDTYDGIIVETKEMDDSNSPRLYLNESEMEFLILKMREMMNYVKGVM